MYKESKIIVTLNEAIELKEILTSECKVIGSDFKKTANKLLFSQLKIKTTNLKRVTLALLKANCDLQNNENIKELDITKRLKEVLSGTLSNMRRETTILGKVKKFFGIKQSRYDEKELEDLLLGYESTRTDIEKFLNKFNSENTIELTLINI